MKRLLTIALLTLSVACTKREKPFREHCDDTVNSVSVDAFNNKTSASFNFKSVTLNQNCLEVEIGASGCDSKNWGMQLIDAGIFDNTVEGPRRLRLILTNDEGCLAVFSKSRSFDLSTLKTSSTHKILLRLEGWNTPIEYRY